METSFKKWFGFLNSPSLLKKQQKQQKSGTYKNLPFGSKLIVSFSLSHGESIHNSALGRKASRLLHARWATSAMRQRAKQPWSGASVGKCEGIDRSSDPVGSWPRAPRKAAGAAEGCGCGQRCMRTGPLQGNRTPGRPPPPRIVPRAPTTPRRQNYIHSSQVFVPTHPVEPSLQPVAGSPR